MPTKQISAVDWLYETLWKQTDFSLPNNILEQAKAMEKEQLTKAYNANLDFETIQTAEQYYNETYKKTI